MKTIEESRELLKKHLQTETTRMHCREVEVIMRKLALEFNENAEIWSAAGLLHDIDCDIEKDNFKMQGTTAANMLREEGYPEEICHAILAHNESLNGIKRESKLDFALSAADNVSGLIYSYGLMKKTLDGMEVSGLKKKYKAKGFAVTVRRELIADIEKAGMPLDKFFEVAIKAMQSISKEIGF